MKTKTRNRQLKRKYMLARGKSLSFLDGMPAAYYVGRMAMHMNERSWNRMSWLHGYGQQNSENIEACALIHEARATIKSAYVNDGALAYYPFTSGGWAIFNRKFTMQLHPQLPLFQDAD